VSAGGTTFLFMGRLLREKGVLEFVEAARAIRLKRPTARFQLLGFVGVENPTAIQRAEIRQWAQAGLIEDLGETDEVRPFIANADCVVLPSYYREGVPRSLLEAASMERPVITTDTPGCREAVLHGVSGYLVAPRNSGDLEAKLTQFLALSLLEREEMGRRGRLHVQTNFDEHVVISRYVEAVAALMAR
jgi:glycosyltransferase involved in cell wall biosynthesis